MHDLKPWTEQDIADARAILRKYPTASVVSRGREGHLIVGDKDRVVVAVFGPKTHVIPSIRPDMSVELSKIVGDMGANPVEHPSHYNQTSIECIDALCAMVERWQDPVAAALAWNIVKYIWRHPYKGKPVEDLQKARYYLDRLIEEAEDLEKKNQPQEDTGDTR